MVNGSIVNKLDAEESVSIQHGKYNMIIN